MRRAIGAWILRESKFGHWTGWESREEGVRGPNLGRAAAPTPARLGPDRGFRGARAERLGMRGLAQVGKGKRVNREEIEHMHTLPHGRIAVQRRVAMISNGQRFQITRARLQRIEYVDKRQLVGFAEVDLS